MIIKQFLLVSITSLFSSIIYLIVSNYLDNFISPIYSNGIGLIIDVSLDFFFQSIIFLYKLSFSYVIIGKFIISKIITIFTSQMLFIIYYKYFKNPKIKNLYIRILISLLVFFILVFPLSKFYVFNEN